MPEVFHQTVRLSAGKHRSPSTGMCVMELASTLAGERFTDNPRSVCPVIAAFLRSYNDLAREEPRQDLIPYAARVVGTRAGAGIERQRAQRCLTWALEHAGGRLPRWAWRRRAIASGRARGTQLGRRECGVWAAKQVDRDAQEAHDSVLALVDELIAIDRPTLELDSTTERSLSTA